jgi:TolA-binding protein
MTQAALFDLEMHARLERTTLAADGLWRDLQEAQQRIAHLETENTRLRKQVQDVQRQLDAARRFGHATVEREALVKALTALVGKCHPDKWQGSPVAEEVTKELLSLRDTLTQK